MKLKLITILCLSILIFTQSFAGESKELNLQSASFLVLETQVTACKELYKTSAILTSCENHDLANRAMEACNSTAYTKHMNAIAAKYSLSNEKRKEFETIITSLITGYTIGYKDSSTYLFAKYRINPLICEEYNRIAPSIIGNKTK